MIAQLRIKWGIIYQGMDFHSKHLLAEICTVAKPPAQMFSKEITSQSCKCLFNEFAQKMSQRNNLLLVVWGGGGLKL